MQPPLCTGIHSRRPGRRRMYQRCNVSCNAQAVPQHGRARKAPTLGRRTSIAPMYRAPDAVGMHRLVLLVQRNAAAISRHGQTMWHSFPNPKMVSACHPVRFHCNCHTSR